MEQWGTAVFICALGAFGVAAYLMSSSGPSKSHW
jgi:hypothetical protein